MNKIKQGMLWLATAASLLGSNTGKTHANDKSIEAILQQYGTIQEDMMPNTGSKYIILAADYHNDLGIQRNVLKAFSELYKEGMLNSVALEGLERGKKVEYDEETRNEFPLIREGLWDQVGKDYMQEFGISMLPIEHPGLGVYGSDSMQMLREFADITKKYGSEENFNKRIKEGSTKEEIFEEFKEIMRTYTDNRSDYMVESILTNPAFGDTVAIKVGADHISRMVDDLERNNTKYIIFHPNKGEVSERDYIDHFLSDMKNN